MDTASTASPDSVSSLRGSRNSRLPQSISLATNMEEVMLAASLVHITKDIFLILEGWESSMLLNQAGRSIITTTGILAKPTQNQVSLPDYLPPALAPAPCTRTLHPHLAPAPCTRTLHPHLAPGTALCHYKHDEEPGSSRDTVQIVFSYS